MIRIDTPRTRRDFQRRLLAWFRRERRDLPWRRTRDPYCVWLSEIMLQQTRVAAVLPYYRRFLRRFPTVRALARARLPSVLRLWAGLGYYSRARNLHRAAKEIVVRHSGRFPRDLEAALRLPGIGRYTAGAVLSIAYDAPHAALDGNVARVLARLGAIRGDLRTPRRWRQLQATAQNLLTPAAPGDWNQAMMELGATICTPRAPRCGECPVSRWCRARHLGIAEELPAKRAKRSPVKITIAAAVLLDPRGRTLLVKSSDARQNGRDAVLFSRMWQFPAVEVRRDADTELLRHLRGVLRADGSEHSTRASLRASKAGQRAKRELEPLAVARHTVTYRRIKLLPFLLRVERLPAADEDRTPLLAQLDRLPISNATRKIAAAALRAVSSGSREAEVRSS